MEKEIEEHMVETLNTMSKVHIWIGTTTVTEEVYLKYFELDFSTEGDFDDPDYKVCGFCSDIEMNWYNEDFIGIVPRFEEEQCISEIIKSTVVNKLGYPKVFEECRNLGITKANTILFYTDAKLELRKSNQRYNGLQYIGVFDVS